MVTEIELGCAKNLSSVLVRFKRVEKEMTRNEDVRVWGREVYIEEPEVCWRQHKTITRGKKELVCVWAGGGEC
jgi:hypothetical protein